MTSSTHRPSTDFRDGPLESQAEWRGLPAKPAVRPNFRDTPRESQDEWRGAHAATKQSEDFRDRRTEQFGDK